MSYDICFVDPATEETIEFDEPLDLKGGTYAVGGTTEACLNITYNYGKFYYKHLDADKGVRCLYGKTGKECVPLLEQAVAKLGTERAWDYWEPTPGNAGAALANLLVLARACPNGICRGD